MTEVATIEVRGGEHTMLRRGALWHRLAVEFSRLALGLPAAGPADGRRRPSAMRPEHGTSR